jgi:hypothetical protein
LKKSSNTLHYLFALSISTLIGSASANQTFIDSQLDTASYNITQYSGNQNIVISTIPTGGKPGSALQVTFNAGNGSSWGRALFINKNFVYNPSSQGLISSISFSSDNYIQSTLIVGTFAANLVLQQEGRFFRYGVGLGTTEGAYQSAIAIDLVSTNFVEILDYSANPTVSNSNSHPDFGGSSIYFGFDRAWTSNGPRSPHTTIERLDNFQVAITSVPEADSMTLAIAGVCIALAIGCKSRRMV